MSMLTKTDKARLTKATNRMIDNLIWLQEMGGLRSHLGTLSRYDRIILACDVFRVQPTGKFDQDKLAALHRAVVEAI